VAARSLLLVDLLLGVALLATIGLAAMRSGPAAPPRSRLVGWLLVAVPLPVIVGSRVIVPSSPLGGEAAFVCGILAFAVGAALVLSGRGETDEAPGEPNLGPRPWWPDFEREFRAYARRNSRSHTRI
jgi:hypothetical protein